VTLITFLVVAGLSDALSARGARHPRERWQKAQRRALRLGFAALLVSTITYALDPLTFVRFGVLHLLAVGSLLLPLIDRWSPRSTWLAVLICAGSSWLIRGVTMETTALVALGFQPATFTSVDHVPLLPWLSALLVGRALGTSLPTTDLTPRIPSPFTLPGRWSLSIYLIHQPLLWLILTIILGWPERM
jgi:uncharacterized membrane protein